MRLLTYSIVLGLTASAFTAPAHAADDVIVNGLHCNSACQAWLGTSGASAQPAPLRLGAPARPAPLPAPRVQMASREVTPVVRQAPASTALEMPAHNGGERGAFRSPASTVSIVPGDQLDVAPARAPDVFSQPPGRGRVIPRLRHPSEQAISPPALRDDSVSRRADTFDRATGRVGSDWQRRRRSMPASADARMEPGLTTLPRLSDVVAVHGTIMVETAADREFERRDMARLVKETTRPKEFKTGFADPLSDKPAVDGQLVGQAP